MILIRADANERIGAGHVMRSRSIARALVDEGEEVAFITADHRGDGLIEDFRIECLDTPWTDMDSETDRLAQRIRALNPSLLLVDSYRVTKAYFDALHALVSVAYMDDLNLAHWNVDCLINYNIFGTAFDYSRYDESETKLLLGPRFAPLRSEFVGIPERVTAPLVTQALVSAGGADPEGVTEKIIRDICPRWPEICFHFIVGPLNPGLSKIRALQGKNVMLHINEKQVARLMQKCDVAISAAGSTLYELCACGVPTITYTLADNQLAAAKAFQEQRIMMNAGDCRGSDSFTMRLSKCLDELVTDAQIRERFSSNMQRMVDGRGAKRIAEQLMHLSRERVCRNRIKQM